MRYVRVRDGGRIVHAILSRGGVLNVLPGDPFLHPDGALAGMARTTGEQLGFDPAVLVPPVSPGKILCAGLNYVDHIRESNARTPESPVIFMKPPTALVAHGAPIACPLISRHVEYEGELAVIIGLPARHVPRNRALRHVAGLCCANDVSARDHQPPDGQWTIGKGFDTFLPLGPWIETGLHPGALAIETRLNGRVRQRSNTRNLLFGVEYLIEYLSAVMTLLPGDVILTGTPSGVGRIAPGDAVEVEIEGIGTLSNPVKLEAYPDPGGKGAFEG